MKRIDNTTSIESYSFDYKNIYAFKHFSEETQPATLHIGKLSQNRDGYSWTMLGSTEEQFLPLQGADTIEGCMWEFFRTLPDWVVFEFESLQEFVIWCKKSTEY